MRDERKKPIALTEDLTEALASAIWMTGSEVSLDDSGEDNAREMRKAAARVRRWLQEQGYDVAELAPEPVQPKIDELVAKMMEDHPDHEPLDESEMTNRVFAALRIVCRDSFGDALTVSSDMLVRLSASAVASMREPTDHMLVAMRRSLGRARRVDRPYQSIEASLRNVWTAGIDAAGSSLQTNVLALSHGRGYEDFGTADPKPKEERRGEPNEADKIPDHEDWV